MRSLARILSVGFSTMMVGQASMADPPRVDTGLKYRQPLTLVQLESETEILPFDATPEPDSGWISDGQSTDGNAQKELKDFFSDDSNEGFDGSTGPESADDAFGFQESDAAENAADDQGEEDDFEETRENPVPFAALPPIRTVSLQAPLSPGILPQDYAGEAFANRSTIFQARGFQRTGDYGGFAQWCAPWVAYQPLYFEDVWLERHGYDHGHLQPIVSAAKFYGRIPLLPYMMGATPHDECTYSLGFARPGDCTPHYFTLPKHSRRGLLYQTAWVTGIVLLTP